ncbi:MAG: GTP-sensing transcriptional pleiotropic repressor CodY [Thermoanaerobacterales bacterium 50_218]|nr:MAG: GTP-sensing transcriptional pleiotropic repressor CodY [Thermoanaerobacterales bacterium 50_218]HAA90232.1 GTP-sensing pleiotropic transcriptional regulator CodY [Peptococcaceae bacterium]
MSDLLKKIGILKAAVQNPAEEPLDFRELAEAYCDAIAAHTYIVGRRGKILGYAFPDGFDCGMDEVIKRSECFPESYNQELLRITETQVNIEKATDKCIFHFLKQCPLGSRKVTIVPVFGEGERLATLIFLKGDVGLGAEEVVLAEFAALVLGNKILGMKSKRAEKEAEKSAAYQIALKTLTPRELRAVKCIFRAIDGPEGLLVITRVAEETGLGRSLIVNALRKLEGAGVIAVRSHGMKGTRITILDPNFLDELEKEAYKT